MSLSCDPVTDAPPHENWRECPQCGFISQLPPRRPGLVAVCPRCSQALWRMRKVKLSFPLACGLAALLFYLFALVAPFLEISSYGRFALARIETGPVQLTAQGFGAIGLLVFGVTLLVPAMKLGILLITLIGLETGTMPRALLRDLFRWYGPLSPWAMIDVYLLGFLVAYTRLTGMAEVHLDTAVYALIGVMLSMAAADGSLDTEAVWRALGADAPPPAPLPEQAQLIGCRDCGLLNHSVPGARCSRCHAKLRLRKTNSLSRSWALVLTAALLYIPANVYPFMVITNLAQQTSYTIMGGIVELAQVGLWPLALLVFFASITIPLMKLLILGYMLLETGQGSTENLEARTRAYQFIDFIGRWSMIDVFMVSILVALLRFGQIAAVRADLGAVCFGGVVVLTIFAVNAFDPRLMWDAQGEDAMPEQTQP